MLVAAPLLLRTAAAIGACVLFVLATAVWLYLVPQLAVPRYYVGVIALAIILSSGVLATILERLPLRVDFAELPLLLYLLPHALLVLSVDATFVLDNKGVDVALGSISRATYISERVRVFAAEDWINSHTATDARVVVLGTSAGYYIDRPYLADWYRERYYPLLADKSTRDHQIQSWCRAGVHYMLLDRAVNEFDPTPNTATLSLLSFRWMRVFTTAPHELYSKNGVGVFSINSCALKTEPG
jgi:hypothetical protein